MKAIQIKILPPTLQKPIRLKASAAHVNSLLLEVYNDEVIEEQAQWLSHKYVELLGWNHVKVNGFGQLPNGDYVATLGDK